MEWTKILEHESERTAKQTCHLIVIGQANSGLPFCHEDQFDLVSMDGQKIIVTKKYYKETPFDNLRHIDFVEFAIRQKGVLYYGIVDCIKSDTSENIVSLTLSIPKVIHSLQQRRHQRVFFPNPLPIVCKIVGLRKDITFESSPFQCHLLDLSVGGMSFITKVKLFFPILLEFQFQLPNETEILKLYGEILRVSHFTGDTYRIAVEFRNGNESQLHMIHQYCLQNHVTEE